jgi:diguanylate cyclase (GGDEF)-like protein
MDPIFSHLYLRIFLSGVSLFALIHFIHLHARISSGRIRAALVVNTAVSITLVCDAASALLVSSGSFSMAAAFLFILKETVPMSLLFLTPLYLGRLCTLKGLHKKINLVFLFTGLGFFAVTSALVAWDHLFNHMTFPLSYESRPGHQFMHAVFHAARIIMINIILLYSSITLALSESGSKGRFPVRNILAAFLFMSYFSIYYLYVMLFNENWIQILGNGFPHISLGMVILILFIDFFINDSARVSEARLKSISADMDLRLYHDSNLDLPNRHRFRKDLSAMIRSGENINGTILVFLDLDDFHNINESYGEEVGNRLLKMLSVRMREHFSGDGVLYRTGGDEFAFILGKPVPDDEAAAFASRVISSLRNPFLLEDEYYTLTASLAILRLPGAGDDPDTILGSAYATMRNAKKRKNAYLFFKSNMLEDPAHQISIVNLLRNCIANEEFILHYQPIVDSEGNIIHAEALLRCTNENPLIGGPGKFIPLLEKAGLMKEIDNLVVRRAFHDMETKIRNRFGISINLSNEQLIDPGYGEFLSGFAAQHSIEPGRVILEITETSLVKNFAVARESLQKLKERGFLIAIDDFGKGFSSLSYLTELPADILKIDMDFVRPVPGDRKKEMMARYIIDLGKSLGLRVLAEGFESVEQRNFFRENGCQLFQGYYFSKPLPLKELLEKYSLV